MIGSMEENDPNYAKITNYIDHNPAAVLSTVGEDGPHGAVVYVITASHAMLCFVTKNQTKKYANLISNPAVALTFFNEYENTTLQVSGNAFLADNSSGLKEIVMDKIAKAHVAMSEWLPPVTKLQNGEYVVIGIELKTARLGDYSGIDQSAPVFTELK